MVRSIAKNATLMTTASIMQKVISFVYFTLIARMVGAEDTGKYVLALSFTTIVAVFVDLSFTNVLVREAAKEKEKVQQYVSTLLGMKMILGVLAYVGLIVAVHFLSYEIELRHLIYLSGITMLFDSIHLTLYGGFRALGDLKYEAMGIVGSQALTLILGSIFLFAGFPLFYLILAFTIPSALNALFAGINLYRRHGIVPKVSIDPDIKRKLIGLVLPFALAGIFVRVYSYIDSILLHKIAGEEVLGWYSIGFKITTAFQFIPLALVAALYPRLSEYYAKDRERLTQLFQDALRYMLLISIPIVVGIAVLAKDLVMLVYTSSYLPAVLPLQIMIFSLLFTFLNFLLGALLNACDREKTQTGLIGTVMVINIILNIILIPLYGAVGAAIAALAGNGLLTVFSLFVVPNIIHLNARKITRIVFQTVFAAVIMGAGVFFAGKYTNVIIAVVVGVVMYPGMLFLMKVVKIEELREMRSMLKRG